MHRRTAVCRDHESTSSRYRSPLNLRCTDYCQSSQQLWSATEISIHTASKWTPVDACLSEKRRRRVTSLWKTTLGVVCKQESTTLLLKYPRANSRCSCYCVSAAGLILGFQSSKCGPWVEGKSYESAATSRANSKRCCALYASCAWEKSVPFCPLWKSNEPPPPMVSQTRDLRLGQSYINSSCTLDSSGQHLKRQPTHRSNIQIRDWQKTGSPC